MTSPPSSPTFSPPTVQLHWHLLAHPQIQQTPTCPRALVLGLSGVLSPWSLPWLAPSLLTCHDPREAFPNHVCSSTTLNPLTLLYFHHSTDCHLHLSQLFIYLFTAVSSDQNIRFRGQGPVFLDHGCDPAQHLAHN